MTDDRHMNDLGPEELDAVRAVEELSASGASPEARERARAAFLTGEVPDSDAQPRPVDSGPHTRRPRRGWQRAWIGVAAALVLMVGISYVKQPRMQWRVTEVQNAAGVDMAGSVPVAGDPAVLGRVEVGADSQLELDLCRELRIRLMPGTVAHVPKGPGRWYGRSVVLEVESGEVYGSSGDHALPFFMTLRTAEAEADLLGTTFAVFRTDDATCFCLFEGGLRVRARGGADVIDLPVGQRVFIYKDGREPTIEPITGMEQMKLQMMYEAAGGAAPAP